MTGDVIDRLYGSRRTTDLTPRHKNPHHGDCPRGLRARRCRADVLRDIPGVVVSSAIYPAHLVLDLVSSINPTGSAAMSNHVLDSWRLRRVSRPGRRACEPRNVPPAA